MRNNPLIFSSEETSNKYGDCIQYLKFATTPKDGENPTIWKEHYAILGLEELSQLKGMVRKEAYSPYRLNGMEKIFCSIIADPISWFAHNTNFSLGCH